MRKWIKLRAKILNKYKSSQKHRYEPRVKSPSSKKRSLKKNKRRSKIWSNKEKIKIKLEDSKYPISNSREKLSSKPKWFKRGTKQSMLTKERSMSSRRKARNYKNSNMCLIIKSKNSRRILLPDNRKLPKWKHKLIKWISSWRISTRLILLWQSLSLSSSIMSKNSKLRLPINELASPTKTTKLNPSNKHYIKQPSLFKMSRSLCDMPLSWRTSFVLKAWPKLKWIVKFNSNTKIRKNIWKNL